MPTERHRHPPREHRGPRHPRRDRAHPARAGRRLGALVCALLVAGGTATAARPADGTSPPAAVTVVYRAPLDAPVQVLRPFDPPERPWLPGHRGVDLASTPAATVRSPAAGVVTFAGVVADRGVVTVLHPDGRRSSLEPVAAEVAAGARVGAGDVLGTTAGDAHGGLPAGPALHWGVREGDTYVDPWALLPGTGPVVLLPVP